MTTVVEEFYKRQAALKDFLSKSKEISFLQDVEDSFRKNFALAAASYFENEITDLLCKYADAQSNRCEPLTSFVRNKALKRQYHTLFDWEKGTNANSFFGLFGEEFKARVDADLKQSIELSEAIKAFLELGRLRNHIVHQNYAIFSAEKSSEDLYALFQSALKFLDYLKQKFSHQKQA